MGGNYGPGVGGFNLGGVMNDGTAQLGFQMGQQAMAKGGEYMETHVRLSLSLPVPSAPHRPMSFAQMLMRLGIIS